MQLCDCCGGSGQTGTSCHPGLYKAIFTLLMSIITETMMAVLDLSNNGCQLHLMAPMDLYRGLSGSVVDSIVLTRLSIKSNGITDGDSDSVNRALDKKMNLYEIINTANFI